MSVSSLPEWKQLLLERKRREEEERERREKQEEEKLASMPAWKRGIIERRRAKQEGLGDKDREKEREGFLVPVDIRSPSDGLSDTDSSVTANLGSDPSLSPDPGQWLDAETKPLSQVSVETIVPVHENPFIRTQSGWRKVKDTEKSAEVGYQESGSEQEAEVGKDKEREKDKPSPRGHDGESGRGIELKIERLRDRSEGGEGERKRDKSEGRERESNKDRVEGRDRERSWESVKDAVKEREKDSLKVRKQEEKREEKDTDTPCALFAPLVSGLRTIRADNIIIIEQERKGSDERRGRWSETERESPEEDHQEKRAMKMDLSEILAGGGSITEIRASEVLIIKPSVSPEERSAGGGGKWSGRDDGEKERGMTCNMDGRRDSMGREHRTDTIWLREKERETIKEKERPWGHATVIKEDRKDSSDDGVFAERGGRVSQLLSKFGEHPKPPSRSKSSDNFLKLAKGKYSEGQEDQQPEERKADGKNVLLRGVPKRSFSFSDRVLCAKENGVVEEGHRERKIFQRAYSEKRVAMAEGEGSEKETKIKLGRARLLEKGRLGKHKDRPDSQPEAHAEKELVQRSNTRTETESCSPDQHKTEVSAAEKVEPVDKRAAEMAGDADGDEGFTVASVKNTEGISFARRVPIRQDGRARTTESQVKQFAEDNIRTLEKERSLEKGREGARRAESQISEKRGSDFRRGEGTEGTIPADTVQQNYVITAKVDLVNPSHSAESHYRHASAFTECSNLLCTVAEPHKGTEWSGTGPQGPYLTQSVLSHHTEELISKIEKIGETTVYSSERGERAYRGAYEINKDAHDAHIYSDARSENLVIPKSPKRTAPMGIPPGPLEIQIPRTVFYVAEEMMVERKRLGSQNDEGQEREEGRGVERRDSWRIGKPLSRVESLREKIRQREMERMRNKQRGAEDGDGDVSDGTEVSQRVGDRYEERGTEIERGWEAAAHMRKRLVEADGGQEGPAAQTSVTAFDVTQEAGVLKTSPQLPASLTLSQAVRGEEVASECTDVVSEVISDSSQISEDEDDPRRHVVEQLRRHRGLQRDDESRGEEREEEEEEEISEGEDQTSPLSPSQSLSPSPPHPNSLAAMSRIYNLKTVGSRTGLCVRERTVDIPSVRLVKVKPHISHAQQETCHQETADVRQLWGGGKLGDSKAKSDEDLSGVQAIQRQIEQFQLKEQEAVKSSHDGCTPPNTPQTGRETKGQQNPRGGLLHQLRDDLKMQQKDQQTSASSPRTPESSQRGSSSTPELKQCNQSRTVTITPKSLRSQSPDNFLKPSDCAPTPAPSPSSPSPAQSPSVSPSPTPSPTLFSIRSASGGQVKRGATITISPKRPGGGGAAASAPAGRSATKTPVQQTPSPSAVAEQTKKRYPTVEEIEVIGGYQNLEKSCMVKSKGTPKKGKVSFDEVQLEQVCEYPSESSMLACTPYPHDLGRDERTQKEQAQDEEEEEQGVIVSKSTRNVGTATGRVLRVDESCPR